MKKRSLSLLALLFLISVLNASAYERELLRIGDDLPDTV